VTEVGTPSALKKQAGERLGAEDGGVLLYYKMGSWAADKRSRVEVFLGS